MDKQRMLWASRRGMLELDLLLAQYVEQCYDDMSVTQQEALSALVLEEDQDLFDWLLDKKQVSDPLLADIVCDIRRYHGQSYANYSGC